MSDQANRGRLRVPVPSKQTIKRVRLSLDGLYQLEHELLQLGGEIEISGSKFQTVSSVDELVALNFRRRPQFSIGVKRGYSTDVTVGFGNILCTTVSVSADDAEAWKTYARAIALLQTFRRSAWWWSAMVMAVIAVDVLLFGAFYISSTSVAPVCSLIGSLIIVLSGSMFVYADSAQVNLKTNASWFQVNATGIWLAVIAGLVGTVSLVVVSRLGLLN